MYVYISLECNVIPQDIKHAEISPLFKKDDKLNKEKYRPVSVLVCQSKLFESIMMDQLMVFFRCKLSEFLSAYRKGYSTQHVLVWHVILWDQRLLCRTRVLQTEWNSNSRHINSRTLTHLPENYSCSLKTIMLALTHYHTILSCSSFFLQSTWLIFWAQCYVFLAVIAFFLTDFRFLESFRGPGCSWGLNNATYWRPLVSGRRDLDLQISHGVTCDLFTLHPCVPRKSFLSPCFLVNPILFIITALLWQEYLGGWYCQWYHTHECGSVIWQCSA